ncbi:MAG: tetratricopeptide repeat protein [Acidobacteria bacterium]|nr:tetratricopeptide repeat protein [Acidobacteriota bacterium]
MTARTFMLVLWTSAPLAAQPGTLSTAGEEFVSEKFQAAKQAEASRNFPVAIENYSAILRKYPDAIPEVYQNLGLVQFLDRRYIEAIVTFERGIKLRPAMAGSRLFLGASYVLAGKPDRALPHLRFAHQASPSQESAMYSGLALHALRRYQEAAPYFRFALSLSTNPDYFLHLLGICYLRMSEQLGNEISRRFPESTYEHTMLARIVDAQQFYQVAAKEYLEAAKLDPLNASLFLPLARWLAVLGLDAAAELAFDRYRRLLPSEAGVSLDRRDLPRRDLADVGIKVDYLAELAGLPPVIAPLPPAPQFNAAINTELSRRIAAAGTAGDVWKQAAALIAASRWPNAAKVLETLRPPPGDWLRDYLLASVLLLGDDAVQAEAVAARIKLPPSVAASAPVLLLRWEICRLLSFQSFQRLTDEHPSSAWTRFARARNLDAQGKREALDEYNAALEADPGLPEIRIALADFHVSNSNFQEALALCQKELELNPLSTAARIRIGRIHIGLRQPDKGIPFIEEALKNDPADPDAHADLARGLELTGDVPKAIAAYARALELDPSMNRLRYVLARLYRKIGRPDLAERENRLFQKNEESARQLLLERTRKLRETATAAGRAQ